MQTTVRALLFLAALGTGVAAASLLGDQQKDQVRRDLTRILSEVYQRAHSYSATGDVVRPEYASTTISLSAPELSTGWTPSCDIQITATHSDPGRNLQALILVPRDRIDDGGATFTAFSFFVGDPVVTSETFDEPLPDWLASERGGYASLGNELSTLIERSDVLVNTTECEGFTYAILTGSPK